MVIRRPSTSNREARHRALELWRLMADRLADLRERLELRNYGDWILVDLAYGSGAMEIGVVEGLDP